ncbi:MAG: hypothetical protein WD225_03225, partial [Ilumatobacteraceae bacterium]
DLVDGVATDPTHGHQVEVRLTPDHSIAFCGVGAARTAALLDAIGGLGLMTDVDEPLAAVSACVGSTGCASAHLDTTMAAIELAASSGSPVERVHISACEKGCGAPAGVRHLVAGPTGELR